MDEKLRGAVVQAVQEAGAYLQNSNGSRKSPYDIEKRSRETILRTFRSVDPSISVWESGSETRSIAICPIDTSVNFSRRLGRYGVMAAYVEDALPMFGALYIPEEKILITAERGKGTRIDGRKTYVSARSDLESALVCCNCDSYLNDGDKTIPLFTGIIEVLSRNSIMWRNSGSASGDFASLAEGRIDAVIIPLKESAHAAGYLIMQEAGAKVTNSKGEPYTLFSENIVAANPQLHAPLLELIQDSMR